MSDVEDTVKLQGELDDSDVLDPWGQPDMDYPEFESIYYFVASENDSDGAVK